MTGLSPCSARASRAFILLSSPPPSEPRPFPDSRGPGRGATQEQFAEDPSPSPSGPRLPPRPPPPPSELWPPSMAFFPSEPTTPSHHTLSPMSPLARRCLLPGALRRKTASQTHALQSRLEHRTSTSLMTQPATESTHVEAASARTRDRQGALSR